LRADGWSGGGWGAALIAKLTLRSGFFVGRRRRAFVAGISRGFVDNFGNMGVGKKYDAGSVFSLRRLTNFLLYPETAVKYAVKICTLKSAPTRAFAFCFAVLPLYFYLRLKLFFSKP
jgi:hypothetical protein